MAITFTSSSSSFTSTSLHQTLCPKYPHSNYTFLVLRPRLRYSSVRFTIRASSAVTLEPRLSTQQQNQTLEVDPFACPVCYEPLIRKGPPGFNLSAIYRSGFKCEKCNKTYSSKEKYLDLTITAGMKNYKEVKPVGTELFRSPLVSFLYERGWRQNFSRSGFPGPDEEVCLLCLSHDSSAIDEDVIKAIQKGHVHLGPFSFRNDTIEPLLQKMISPEVFNMAQEYFKSAEGGLLVDVSCGSGLFSRKFAKSGTYSKVIALDFSENMLRQCYDFIMQDDTLSTANLALVRADVSRLPFPSGSVDAVHAGAALHCWPAPSNAVAEICRVLRSGGVFVGTTFVRTNLNSPWIIQPFRQRIIRDYNYFTAEEIEDLCSSCGFTNYTSKIQRAFIMYSAQKP